MGVAQPPARDPGAPPDGHRVRDSTRRRGSAFRSGSGGILPSSSTSSPTTARRSRSASPPIHCGVFAICNARTPARCGCSARARRRMTARPKRCCTASSLPTGFAASGSARRRRCWSSSRTRDPGARSPAASTSSAGATTGLIAWRARLRSSGRVQLRGRRCAACSSSIGASGRVSNGCAAGPISVVRCAHARRWRSLPTRSKLCCRSAVAAFMS